MASKSTIGMKVIAVVSILLGGMIAVGNTIEVLRGETFDGVVVDSALMAILGLTGAAFAAMLFVGGIGTWQARLYGRRFSLIAAAGTIVINAAAVLLYGFPFAYFLVGASYPVILLIVFNIPSWKASFRSGAAVPSQTSEGSPPGASATQSEQGESHGL